MASVDFLVSILYLYFSFLVLLPSYSLGIELFVMEAGIYRLKYVFLELFEEVWCHWVDSQLTNSRLVFDPESSVFKVNDKNQGLTLSKNSLKFEIGVLSLVVIDNCVWQNIFIWIFYFYFSNEYSRGESTLKRESENHQG